MNNLVNIGSEISRNTNCHILGDCSGKTISRRTGLGLRRALDLDVTPRRATDIAHLGMATSYFLLKSRDERNRNIGKLLVGGLVLAYLNK